MHFGDIKQTPNIMCLLCLYIMFDVLADHRKNLLIQMCRVVRVLLCVSCVSASCVHIWFVSCPR